MADTLTCDIVTPEKLIVSSEAQFVAVPAYDGEMGVLKNHAPIVSVLGAGEVRVNISDSDIQRYVIAGGYVQITNESKVIVLADHAQKADDIDKAAVAAKKAELEAQLAAMAEDDDSRSFVNQKLAWVKTLDAYANR